ncbi:cathepsin L-like [Montipora capricornis]|uniref:cathepsin L-like n=1 Tax=Montipora capricornis TaxID=246305 RepID=UPI0035F1413F
MMARLSLALVVVFFSAALSDLLIKDNEWHVWKKFHNKKYESDDEESLRYAIWNDNLKKIERHNADKTQSFTMAMNHLGDMTSKEVHLILNGYNRHIRDTKTQEPGGSAFLLPSNVVLPKKVDWRTKGYVTPVKNQEQCGSCWAFSATGSLEGQHFKKTGKLVSLSEQNLVDCSDKFGNFGCEGGLMDNAFRYIKANHGIDTEASYPYVGMDEKCRFNRSDVGADDTGYVDVKSGDEDALKMAVATVGPISVAIDAGHMSFQFYKEGVYVEPECSTTLLDHGVLAVGYGTTESDKDYWLVKNSWGTSWGMEGYIKMARNRDNMCGIATNASYPLV